MGLGGGEEGPHGPWAGLRVGPAEDRVTVEVARGPAAVSLSIKGGKAESITREQGMVVSEKVAGVSACERVSMSLPTCDCEESC